MKELLEEISVFADGVRSAYSKRHVYFMLAQLCSGLPLSVPGLNWHRDSADRAASSKRVKPEVFSTCDSSTLPSGPIKKRSWTVPSSSFRREALGYSGFWQLTAALMIGAVLTGGAATTGAVGGGAGGAGVADTEAIALTPALAVVGTSTGGT